MTRRFLLCGIFITTLFCGCAHMRVQQSDLLPGEHVIRAKAANAIISVNNYGLSRFAFDQLMWTIGMKGKEAIGGKLHLTNYRLIFKSHAMNRVTGKFSIFLPTIQEVNDRSFGVVKKIEIMTQTQRHEFVVWGIPSFIEAITSARDSLTRQEIQLLRTTAASNYHKCGEGMKICTALEGTNKAFLTVDKIAGFTRMAADPIQASGIINLWELFSKE